MRDERRILNRSDFGVRCSVLSLDGGQSDCGEANVASGLSADNISSSLEYAITWQTGSLSL